MIGRPLCGLVTLLALLGCGETPPSKPAAPKSATPVTAAPAAGSPMARAIKLYDRRCRMCHGARGRGDGPAAGTLQPRPRTFTDATWQASVDDAHLRTVILGGGTAVGLSAQMPPNADLTKKPEVLTALIAHVRALGKQ